MAPEPMCVCRVVVEKKDDAAEYAEAHLTTGRSFPDLWVTEYVCRSSGTRWLMDYPASELQGGGPPRLRIYEAVAWELKHMLPLADVLLADDPAAHVEAASLRSRLDAAFEPPSRR